MQRMLGALAIIFILCFSSCDPVWAHPINMKALAQIESSNNPKAWNKKTNARGLYQITPIVLKQFLQANPGNPFTLEALFEPNMTKFVADWYLNWLSKLNDKDTVDDILIGWHDGVGNLRKYRRGERKLGPEMRSFLKKYHRLTETI